MVRSAEPVSQSQVSSDDQSLSRRIKVKEGSWARGLTAMQAQLIVFWEFFQQMNFERCQTVWNADVFFGGGCDVNDTTELLCDNPATRVLAGVGVCHCLSDLFGYFPNVAQA